MNSVQKFNSLNGKTVSRKELLELSTQAFDEQQFEVFNRLNTLLTKYPDADEFILKLSKKATFDKKAHGGPKPKKSKPTKKKSNAKLSAPRHTGLAKEALTECGRLRPGYRYVKGGKLEKVLKPKNKKGDYVWLVKGTKDVKVNSRAQILKAYIKDDQVWYKVKFENNVISELAENHFVGFKTKPKDFKFEELSNQKKLKKEKENKIDNNLGLLRKKAKELEEKIILLQKIKAKANDILRLRDASREDRRDASQKRYNSEKELKEANSQLFLIRNQIRALESGGKLRNIKDKNGSEYLNVPDFSSAKSQEIEFNDNTVLNQQVPGYIPLFDDQLLERTGIVLDAAEISPDIYVVSQKYDRNATSLVILNFDQLVLTTEYYETLIKARYKKDAEIRTERNKLNWEQLSDERKRRFYEVNNIAALYKKIPASLRKKVNLSQYGAMTWKERDEFYPLYKREKSKRISGKFRKGSSMSMSNYNMYLSFIDPSAKRSNRDAYMSMWEYWQNYLKKLKIKLNDLDIARKNLSEVRKKGMETSFGKKGSTDKLRKKYGVYVKRQNGDAISPTEIKDIENAMDQVLEYYGDIRPLLRKWGTTVVHTGEVLVYARKALGVFYPAFKSVSASYKLGKIEFETTLAHELAHLMDYHMGTVQNKRFASDNYSSTFGLIGTRFREFMNKETNSGYLNSTVECVARAFEQYYAIKRYGNKSLKGYVEMLGPVESDTTYYNHPFHVNKDNFETHVKPLIEQCIKEFHRDVIKNIKTIDLDRKSFGLAAGVNNFSGMDILKINDHLRSNKKEVSKKLSAPKQTCKAKTQIGLFGTNKQLSITSDDFKNMKVSELRAFTLDYYKKELHGKKIAIKNSLKEVVFTTKAGRKIAKGSAMYKEKPAVLQHLEKVIQNSTYNNFGNPKPTDPKDLLGYLNFKSKIVIDGKKRHVRIAIALFDNKKTLLKNFDLGKSKKESDLSSKGLDKEPSVGEDKSHSDNKSIKNNTNNKKLGSIHLNLEPKPVVEKQVNQITEVAQEEQPPINHQPKAQPQAQPQLQTQPKQVVKENTDPNKPKQTAKKVKGVLTSSDLMTMEFDTLNFNEEWTEFMQEPAKNMRLAIWGKPKNGKTAGATKFASYLTNFGNVLYNFADQGINKSTRDLWQLSGLDQKPNAFLSATRELDELDQLLSTGDYDFVFIDMINTYIHRTGIKYFEFEDRFLKKYPNISFILIFEVTKNGDFKGDQGWTHLVDAVVTVESFVMENQGRYGVGHHVIWEEGLRKTNPKKHKEYFDDIEVPTEPLVL